MKKKVGFLRVVYIMGGVVITLAIMTPALLAIALYSKCNRWRLVGEYLRKRFALYYIVSRFFISLDFII